MVDRVKNYSDRKLEEAVKQRIKKIESINEMNDEGEDSSTKVELFFSFDIVNSTAYKDKNQEWVSDLTGEITYLKETVEGTIQQARLWRIIGDEIVFTCEIRDIGEIYEIINSLYIVLIENNGNNCGKKVEKNDSGFNLQAAAWIAAITNWDGNDNSKNISRYDNVLKKYKIAPNRTINEFLGADIDIGFRIKKETEKRRLVISYELALILSERTEYSSRLHVITYKTLKGVWEGKPYPIIWYYDERVHNKVPFDESFLYDESIVSEFAKEYFKNTEKQNGIIPKKLFLDANKALKKICEDLKCNEKIKHLKKIIAAAAIDEKYTGDEFGEKLLELHFAAVCCDVEKRTIMIVKRKGRKQLDGKWEFGCSKASAEKHIEESIAEDYYNRFGLSIEVICDRNRNEHRAEPIALYEVFKDGEYHKGILVVARIIDGIDHVDDVIHKNRKHSEVRWISESDIASFNEDGVEDLRESMQRVFERWDYYFKEG